MNLQTSHRKRDVIIIIIILNNSKNNDDDNNNREVSFRVFFFLGTQSLVTKNITHRKYRHSTKGKIDAKGNKSRLKQRPIVNYSRTEMTH